MSSQALKVPIAVFAEFGPLLDALRDWRLDIGSIDAERVFPGAPPDTRLICVHIVDREAVVELVQKLRDKFKDQPAVKAGLAALVLQSMPLDSWLVVFPGVLAVETDGRGNLWRA